MRYSISSVTTLPHIFLSYLTDILFLSPFTALSTIKQTECSQFQVTLNRPEGKDREILPLSDYPILPILPDSSIPYSIPQSPHDTLPVVAHKTFSPPFSRSVSPNTGEDHLMFGNQHSDMQSHPMDDAILSQDLEEENNKPGQVGEETYSWTGA